VLVGGNLQQLPVRLEHVLGQVFLEQGPGILAVTGIRVRVGIHANHCVQVSQEGASFKFMASATVHGIGLPLPSRRVTLLL
jgi:hypothetical protein